ncbi:MAG: WXG100 family type VII secretion target [Chloroflexi bacterium]|nr:WXG100 family type VII secretion target [Chloroflexota bacterium]
MPAPEVKIEYSGMKAIHNATESQRESTQQLLQRISDQVDTLRSDNWIGDNADKFYNVMDSELLPAVQRLVNAFNSMEDAIDNIMSIFEAAEDEGRGLFPQN